MFGLVPFFAHNNDFDKADKAFDSLMNAFNEPFMQNFQAPDFKVDVKDNGDSYDLKAELPGMKKENISLTYKDNYLTIAAKAEQSQDEKDEKGNWVRRERSQSDVSRSFYIDNIDETKATAEYKDGILSVHMPKAVPEPEKQHEITINGAE